MCSYQKYLYRKKIRKVIAFPIEEASVFYTDSRNYAMAAKDWTEESGKSIHEMSKSEWRAIIKDEKKKKKYKIKEEPGKHCNSCPDGEGWVRSHNRGKGHKTPRMKKFEKCHKSMYNIFLQYVEYLAYYIDFTV